MRAKLISENLDKYNFEKKNDPLSSLGIGKRELIKLWLDKMDIQFYTINDDFTIDVKYEVNVSNRGLTEFPDYIQFNEIEKGWFICSNNFLTSLKGCPYKVNSVFACNNNDLMSLKYCPKYCEIFYCQDNPAEFTEEDVRKLCKVKDHIHTISTL